jgi:arylsulfatase A-like enzyme
MNSFFYKETVKIGCLAGLLTGILLGLSEGVWIHLSGNVDASFAKWMLFYFSAVGLYAIMGFTGGAVIAVVASATCTFCGRWISEESRERLWFSLLFGILSGTVLFVYAKLYLFRSIEPAVTILLMAGSIIVCCLFFSFAGPFMAGWIKEIKAVKIVFVFAVILATGWTFSFIMIVPEDIPSAQQGKPDRPNILLITIDTLRADHLGSYGYEKIKTPVLDGLAARGVVFTQHICQQPITTASHTSLLTSTYPVTNGVQGNNFPLDSEAITLQKIMQQHGYTTGAFISGYPLKSHASGLNEGFHHYDDRLFFIDNLLGALSQMVMKLTSVKVVEKYLHGKDYLTLLQRRADETTAAATKWLEGIGGQNFFMWVHYFDPHAPYDPPPPYDKMYDPDYRGSVNGSMQTLFKIWDKTLIPTEADIQHIIALYDGEISYNDEQIGVLLDKLRQMQVLNNTVIIVTADHGESLWEHDYNFKHGDFLYDASIRIPLIIVLPHKEKVISEIDHQTENIDIVPTVLEYLDISQPSAMQGESLLGLIRGAEDYKKRVAFSQAIGRIDERYERETKKYGLRTIKWKFIRYKDGENELFNIQHDPAELKNLAVSKREISEEFNRILDDKLLTIKKSEREIAPLDEDTLHKLKSLGYIN